MAFTLSNLLQGAYRKLGYTDTFLATNGSTTTAVNTLFKEKYQDDDIVDWSLFVTTDAAGAAPEDEYGVVSGYVESTSTITINAALTAAIASGDRITLANNQIPLQEMIQLANLALEELGDFDYPYTSLATVAEQTEYSIPVAQKRKIVKVEIQTLDDANKNLWRELSRGSYEVTTNTAGTAGLLIFRDELDEGWDLKVWYKGSHPYVTDYDDPIMEVIHPTLATTALVAEALNWLNSKISGSEDYIIDKLNDARRELDIAKATHKTQKMKLKNKGLDIGSYD